MSLRKNVNNVLKFLHLPFRSTWHLKDGNMTHHITFTEPAIVTCIHGKKWGESFEFNPNPGILLTEFTGACRECCNPTTPMEEHE